MNRNIKYLASLVVTAACLSWMQCSTDNPTKPQSSLVGNWELVSITAKATSTTFNAGETVDLGGGTTMAMTGSLVLSETNFTLSLTVTWTFPGTAPETETDTTSGTYSTDGSTMTFVEDGGGDTETLTYSHSGSRLTLEDDEQKLAFQKK